MENLRGRVAVADGRIPVIEGQGTRAGAAVPEDGGYRLSGDWSFASGVKHAEYIHTGAQDTVTGEGLICVLPIAQATLIDNWDVLGLRATGSIDYTIDSVFIPQPYTHPALTEEPLRGGQVFTMGIINFGMICHSAWALGVGRRMLDELRDLVQTKVGRPGSMTESDAFQGDFAKAEATYRAARAMVYETWHDIEETLRRGDRLSVRQNTLTRLTLQHTTAAMHEVCMVVYLAAGTTALRAGTIQRFFRDMHAGTQHVTSGPAGLQACGRELAGLAPGKTWHFLALD